MGKQQYHFVSMAEAKKLKKRKLFKTNCCSGY